MKRKAVIALLLATAMTVQVPMAAFAEESGSVDCGSYVDSGYCEGEKEIYVYSGEHTFETVNKELNVYQSIDISGEIKPVKVTVTGDVNNSVAVREATVNVAGNVDATNKEIYTQTQLM